MYKVYCDFDATVTENDVWHELFGRFGKPEAFSIWTEFGSGRMTVQQCIRFACATVDHADPVEALTLFQLQKLRAGFPEFVRFCDERELELRIVSDGFSAYIRPILQFHSIQVPFHANDVEFMQDGKLSIDFQNGRESCTSCASCKCAYLIMTSSEEDTIVYIGDGYSDICPVKIADVVFARDTLLGSCSSSGIPHHPFSDFFQVMGIMENYLAERPKYRREQARRNRKQLVMSE